jgi:hypothetical protein
VINEQIDILSTTIKVSDRFKWLAHEPRKVAMSYKGLVINGQKFYTRDAEKSTQDSGVFVEADTLCRSSAKDMTQVLGKVCWYGIIKDIIVLDYYEHEVPLFLCDWANVKNGVKVEDGFTLVKFPQGQNQGKIEPFIYGIV